MSAADVDAYLAAVEDAADRAALQVLRDQILAVVPDAEQRIAYGAPAFRVGGTTVAGFAAYRKHLSYFPHSSTVIAALGDDALEWVTTKGSLHFTPDRPLPDALVARLIAIRRAEIGR